MSDTKNLRYWYDGQIRRYLLQLIRVFSHFEVAELTDTGIRYNRVPCKYANASRMVSQIIRGNSENVLNSTPMMTVGISGLSMARNRTQDPFYEDRRQVAEREWSQEEGVYTSEQGNLYTLERYMPVPYTLSIQVDIWTTNIDSKLQLLEQLLVIFNPSIQLQSNDNPLDWSNVFEVEMTNINFSSRSVGSDEGLEISTLSFDVPIWISPPAKVTRQKIIQRIIANIHSLELSDDIGYNAAYYDFFRQFPDPDQVIVTPNDLRVNLIGNTAQLVTIAGEPQVWQDIIEMQGELSEFSRLEVNLKEDIEDMSLRVVGFVSADSNDPSILNFSLDSDTLPANTLNDVDRIIAPSTFTPVPVTGTRYLITETILAESAVEAIWNVTAPAGSIIEYNGAAWVVSFNASSEGSQWVTNIASGEQLMWTGTEWISSWQGEYVAGYWRLIL
jgi:hypothetical protein